MGCSYLGNLHIIIRRSCKKMERYIRAISRNLDDLNNVGMDQAEWLEVMDTESGWLFVSSGICLQHNTTHNTNPTSFFPPCGPIGSVSRSLVLASTSAAVNSICFCGIAESWWLWGKCFCVLWVVNSGCTHTPRRSDSLSPFLPSWRQTGLICSIYGGGVE